MAFPKSKAPYIWCKCEILMSELNQANLFLRTYEINYSSSANSKFTASYFKAFLLLTYEVDTLCKI